MFLRKLRGKSLYIQQLKPCLQAGNEVLQINVPQCLVISPKFRCFVVLEDKLSLPTYIIHMKTVKNSPVATEVAPVHASNDLFAQFQAFLAMQAANKPTPVEVVVPVASVKSKAKKAVKAPAPASPAAPLLEAKREFSGCHIHELENSCFVYGSEAPAKLAAFLAKKPHLNRGYKEYTIKGVGIVKAHWFGGRQIAKIRKAIA